MRGIVEIKVMEMQNKLQGMTKHAVERNSRFALVNELMREEDASLVNSFYVDRGHAKGPEIHNVYDNGVIFIYNYQTGRLVTVLIGRVAQYKSYYEMCGMQYNKATARKCYKHYNEGLCYM